MLQIDPEIINNGAPGCDGEVILDGDSIPDHIMVTCPKCDLKYLVVKQ